LVSIPGEVRAQAEAAGGIRDALYISCSGPGGPHFGARHAEFKMVREALGDIPLIGFSLAAKSPVIIFTAILACLRFSPGRPERIFYDKSCRG
jgi:small ligand-binding sensory domain FIST